MNGEEAGKKNLSVGIKRRGVAGSEREGKEVRYGVDGTRLKTWLNT